MTGKPHHANVILDDQSGVDALTSFVEQSLSFNSKQNPDFLFLETETFGIEEARDFTKWALGKPLAGDKKVALLRTSSLTLESQNALLKIFEEPSVGTYFFLVVPNLGNILPTLLSRIQILQIAGNQTVNNQKSDENLASKFTKLSVGQRLGLIKQYSKGDKSELKKILQQLEKLVPTEGFDHESKKKILTAKIFSTARGGSARMLLEWLACVL